MSIGQTREQALYSCATPEGITEHNDKLNFTSRNTICTDPEVVKYININFHFIQDGNGRGNFRINDDGQGNSNYTGYDRAKDYVNYMNIKFQSNAVMKLPCVNGVPSTNGQNLHGYDNLPVKVQYVLKGVYFHRAPQYINDGVGNWAIQSALGVNTGTEINMYMINNTSIGYDGEATCGSSFNLCVTNGGLGVRIWKDYQNYLNNHPAIWELAKLANHEVGHLLNLEHSWYGNDWCTDTEPNNNCQALNLPSTVSPCQLPSCCQDCDVSNNLMGYNTDKGALSPQQIARIHNRLNTDANSYVYSCNGCIPSNSFFYLPISVCIEGETAPFPKIILDGRGSWKESSYNIEIYQVGTVGSFAQIGNTYQMYSYTGTVGTIDLLQIYNFYPGNIYQVRLITNNGCGASSSVGWVTILPESDCGAASIDDDTPTTAGKVGVVQPSILEEVHSVKQVVEDNPKNTSILSTNNELRLSPNPANEYLNIEFDVEINETFELTLWNSLGGQVSIIRKGIAIQTQELQITFDILEFPSGNYFVTLQTSKRKITKQLIIAK